MMMMMIMLYLTDGCHDCRSDDEYDEAIGTLLSVGASVLRVLGERILDTYTGPEVITTQCTLHVITLLVISKVPSTSWGWRLPRVSCWTSGARRR